MPDANSARHHDGPPLHLLTEDLISIREAAAEWPAASGKRKAVQPIYRYAHRGVRGVKLEVMKVGHCYVTSRQAITRFLTAINADR